MSFNSTTFAKRRKITDRIPIVNQALNLFNIITSFQPNMNHSSKCIFGPYSLTDSEIICALTLYLRTVLYYFTLSNTRRFYSVYIMADNFTLIKGRVLPLNGLNLPLHPVNPYVEMRPDAPCFI